MTARARLRELFACALAAASADAAVDRALEGGEGDLALLGERVAPGRSLHVLAIGKAACAMAHRFETRAGARIARGLAITKDGHARTLAHFRVLLAAHPVPDARSVSAADAALGFAAGVPPRDTLVVLLSGGASALVGAPCEGVGLDALAATNAALLASGAAIDETNCVRKHLGRIGGGRLAAASAAHRLALVAISDVPGDRLDVIGSGPCTADPSTFADALAVLARRGLRERVPSEVVRALEAGARGERDETLDATDAALARVRARITARNADARTAVVAAAARAGLPAVDAGETLAGEAREAGAGIVERAREALGGRAGIAVFGGETTVTVRGDGRGGRNQELALAAALAGAGRAGWVLLAAGTDGGDGTSDAAGAFADGETLARGARAGVDAEASLARNDAHRFFAREGGALRTGPTGTNVMDLAIVAFEE